MQNYNLTEMEKILLQEHQEGTVLLFENGNKTFSTELLYDEDGEYQVKRVNDESADEDKYLFLYDPYTQPVSSIFAWYLEKYEIVPSLDPFFAKGIESEVLLGEQRTDSFLNIKGVGSKEASHDAALFHKDSLYILNQDYSSAKEDEIDCFQYNLVFKINAHDIKEIRKVGRNEVAVITEAFVFLINSEMSDDYDIDLFVAQVLFGIQKSILPHYVNPGEITDANVEAASEELVGVCSACGREDKARANVMPTGIVLAGDKRLWKSSVYCPTCNTLQSREFFSK